MTTLQRDRRISWRRRQRSSGRWRRRRPLAMSDDDHRRRLEADLGARRAALEAETAAVMELKIRLVRAREKEDALRQGLEQMKRSRAELVERLERLHAEADALEARAASRAKEQEGVSRRSSNKPPAKRQERQASFEQSRSGRRGASPRDRCERAATRRSSRGARSRSSRSLGVRRAPRRAPHAPRACGRDDARALSGGARQRWSWSPGTRRELEARCQRLQEKVERMDRGAVGVEAMEELGSMEERRGFLANEKADLERSLADLQKTIANLNRMSRDRFSETFAAVNEKFQETFPKLFRGARAHLALTDESDLMSTGRRHPRAAAGNEPARFDATLRRPEGTHRGEPDLLALHVPAEPVLRARRGRCAARRREHRPVQSDRHARWVSESQFLIITHNQRTMEVADCLYGVTMEEPGVSRIVSVRLQSAA